MASSQPPYGHPGPSNYYQHPAPPPHYAYGNHSPVHGPAPYQYQYPVPPMNAHHHPIHPSSSPRNRGGYPHSRGGPVPGYQNYHPHPHAPPPHHYPYPQHSHSPGPYPPPPPNKYPQPYSPSYAPVHPSSPYSPAWQGQPLSPLPKQLSMLPPVSTSPGPPPPTQPPAQEESIPPLSNTVEHEAEPQPAEHVPTPPPRSPPTHVGSIRTLDKATGGSISHPSSPSQSTAGASTAAKFGSWVIWSKRPSDPSNAPGIIISSRARPPEEVVQNALDLPTPPPSPDSESKFSQSEIHSGAETLIEQAPVPSSSTTATETTTTPACSTAPDTPVPGSPLSTNTSISIAAASSSPSKEKDQIENITATPPTESKALIEKDAPAAATTDDSQPTAVPSQASESTSEKTTSPAAPAPKAAPKSWASLLRPTGTAQPKGPNSLPTSSIVGFSIPADSPSSSAQAQSNHAQAQKKKPELIALLTSAPSAPPIPPKIRPRGLVNSGNMCFANAVLQVLVYCPPFWRLFSELGKIADEAEGSGVGSIFGEREGKSTTPLVEATVRFLREFAPKREVTGKGKGVDRERFGSAGYEEVEDDDILDSFLPTYVYDALKEQKRFDHMRGGHQEDAEEFLGFYLDTLEEELLSLASSLQPATVSGEKDEHSRQEEGWLEVGKRNRAVMTRTVKSAESPITRIFGGKFRSTLHVPHQKDSAMVEDWRSLRLDIQREQIHNIKEALTFISSPQSVQVTSVTRPGQTLDATQLVQIEALPPILVLHLKRFLYDPAKGEVAKVGKQVAFAPELEIGPEVMAPGKKIHTTRYKLFGVLYHHGLSASGGHYTLDVLHPNIDMMTTTKPREAWIRIDDELVSDVRAEDVFGGMDRDDRCAYLLFYRRVGGPIGRT
ncbi:cysteine proteinase [Hygrophoropsis aurantiaca]|uniref:Cysteine proteinase n=1 Tax=Hygrophoropsis aurantiaca TaxID=72124 RepID=A0ACB7ZZ75_9AGAM|nr:cysteine proteinase [Hygrophoropsis aurantiaca]